MSSGAPHFLPELVALVLAGALIAYLCQRLGLVPIVGCFGTAYLTSLAGVSLSLGAFLAGLVVSESSFSEHALGEILPLQILGAPWRTASSRSPDRSARRCGSS